jgi:hypothetical protein
MTETLKIQIIDAITKESEVRPFTEQELALYNDTKVSSESLESIIASKQAAKASALSKLAALGLTEEEIAAL